MTCIYCNSQIIEEADGWGYDQEGYERNYWHSECFQEVEQIEI